MKGKVHIISKRTLYKGFFEMIEYHFRFKRFSGEWSKPIHRELLLRPKVGAVLPYDPAQDQVVLIEQFRIGALDDENPWLFELIAGLVEADETSETLVYREAKEEAGLTLFDTVPICEYWVSPGGTDEYVSMFCGKVDSTDAGGVHGLAQEDEDIKVHVLSSEDAFKAVENGKVRNAATIISLQWLQLNKNKLDRLWK